MKQRVLLFFLAWVIFFILTFALYPTFGSNVFIPISFFMGVGAWLFGRSICLMIGIFAQFHHFLLFQYFADTYLYYADRAFGPVITLGIMLGTTFLKKNMLATQTLNAELDRLVQDRTTELHRLTAQLLERTENTKITLGKQLHDGMGQSLTGVQLMCASLTENLNNEEHASRWLAEDLKTQASKVHSHIRNISRMHFPVEIREVGLMAALNELSSGIEAIKPVEFTIEEASELPPLSESVSLQLYRICQEATFYAIDSMKANRILVRLQNNTDNYCICFQHNGTNHHTCDPQHTPCQLILHRLRQISGQMIESGKTEGMFKTLFCIPKT